MASFIVPFAASAGPLDSISKTIANVLYRIGAIIAAGLSVLIEWMASAYSSVMQYQGWANEPFVTAGWAALRDLVNLSFILGFDGYCLYVHSAYSAGCCQAASATLCGRRTFGELQFLLLHADSEYF